MRVAFLYGPWCDSSRPIDFNNLAESSRGLTGSEHSCIQYAVAMKERGHQVSLYASGQGEPRDWCGITLCDIARIRPEELSAFAAICGWNEPDVFRFVPKGGPVRLLNQQLNDFNYCQPGFDEFVDVYTSPSAHHMEYLKALSTDVVVRGTTPSKWQVLPNGCAPWIYDGSKPRIDGRVLWASSADRGLHLLLQWWPEIKKAVPHASLRCFYNFAYGGLEGFEEYNPTKYPTVGHDILEIAQRVRYIKYALDRLKHLDVTHEGSVSRTRMRDEMMQSSVLAYPCDTIRYTEGFSVTTMEACAAGVLPIISDVDSLGHIYGSAVPMVQWPPQKDEFVALVVRGLTDPAWREEQIVATKALAEQHTWKVLSQRLEYMLKGAMKQPDNVIPIKAAAPRHPPSNGVLNVSPRGDTKFPWDSGAV